jgi:hypothetical protein
MTIFRGVGPTAFATGAEVAWPGLSIDEARTCSIPSPSSVTALPGAIAFPA